MMRTLVLWMCFAAAGLGVARADPARIDVFVAPGAGVTITDAQRAALNVAGVVLTVWDLGGFERLRQRLAGALPSTRGAGIEAVRAAARGAVQGLDPASLQQESRSAAEGAALARSAGVEKLPAIVFDIGGQARVVYGVADLGTALAYERQWRERPR